MAKKTIFDYTWEVYQKNFSLILLAAVPGLVGLLIPIFIGMPAYEALGAVYLRTGSIPDLNQMSAGFMLLALLISLFLMSFATVGVNLVVKRQRTLNSISLEELRSMTAMSMSVLFIFVMAEILLFIIQLITFEYRMQALLAPILNLMVGVAILFLPTAMVIDDVRPYRALERSVETVRKKWKLVLQWIIVSFILLSIVDGLLLWLVPHPFASWLVVMFNSLVIMPYLIVMLAQIYISKYTILVD